MNTLIIIGAAIFVFLGVIHSRGAAQSTPSHGAFAPRDPVLQEALGRAGGIGLSPELHGTFWDASVGFHHSHSLGVVLTGLVIGVPAFTDPSAALSSPWWLAAALGLPPIYIGLSHTYWFSTPTRAIGVAAGFVYAGVGLSLLT